MKTKLDIAYEKYVEDSYKELDEFLKKNPYTLVDFQTPTKEEFTKRLLFDDELNEKFGQDITRELTIEERKSLLYDHPRFDPFDLGVGKREEGDEVHHLNMDHKLCDGYRIPKRAIIE